MDGAHIGMHVQLTQKSWRACSVLFGRLRSVFISCIMSVLDGESCSKGMFPRPLHITQDCLLIVPSQQGRDDTYGIIRLSESRIKDVSWIGPGIWLECLNFEPIVWVHRDGIIIPKSMHGFS